MSNIRSLSVFAQQLRRLPRVVAMSVAQKAAPAISALAEASFAASADPYGTAWAPGIDGKRITLRQTGALARYIHYVAIGTRLRVALGTSYAKYQIGKRPVFPRNGELPLEYQRTLARIAVAVIREEMRGFV